MKKETNIPYSINSISEQHRLLSLAKPEHPLISVFNFEDIVFNTEELSNNFTLNFYCIAIKKNYKGKLKYGQNYYDFDEGIMSFISPNQLLSTTADESATEGCCLIFHPDFIAQYPLGKMIKSYGFFSYGLNEALHLSEKEENMIMAIFATIKHEYSSTIDHFSQDVIVSQLDLLLNYCNRFYNRQFLTRKNVNTDLMSKFEIILDSFFDSNTGLPTVQKIAAELNLSPNYLSDMLKSATGHTAQHHIHIKLIEKAKIILSSTSLSVSEIAYELGFEHPQSFNKLFKNKTTISPLEFRNSFN